MSCSFIMLIPPLDFKLSRFLLITLYHGHFEQQQSLLMALIDAWEKLLSHIVVDVCDIYHRHVLSAFKRQIFITHGCFCVLENRVKQMLCVSFHTGQHSKKLKDNTAKSCRTIVRELNEILHLQELSHCLVSLLVSHGCNHSIISTVHAA